MGLLQDKGITGLGGNRGTTASSSGLLQRAGITKLSQSKPSPTPQIKKTTATKVTAAKPQKQPSFIEKANQTISKAIKGIVFKLVPPSDKQTQRAIEQVKKIQQGPVKIKPGQTKLNPKQLDQVGGETSAQLKSKKVGASKFADSIDNILSKVPDQFTQTRKTLTDLMNDPLSLKADHKKLVSNTWDAIKKPVIDQLKLEQEKFKKPPKTVSEKIGTEAKRVAGAVNIIFTPITALFTAAEHVPGLATVAKLITVPFVAAGDITPRVSNKLIDSLPISKKSKEDLKPGIGEILTLASQIALGRALHGKKKAQLVKKYGETEAKTIVETATDLAEQRKEVLSKKAETSVFKEGEYTPKEIIGTVIKEGKEKTPEGKAAIQAATEAERRGQNIEITKTKEVREVKPKAQPTEKAVVEDIPQIKNAKNYTSASDFADAAYSARPKQQIGTIEASKITIRDAVDKNSAEYKALKEDIMKNGFKEPINITVEKGKLITTEGSNRTAIAVELNKKVPVIVNKGEVPGLKTIQEIYEAQTKPGQGPKAVSVPRSQIPVGEGEVKTSGLEARIKSAEAIQKHLDKTPQEIIDQLGLSTYKEMSKKENIQKAIEYVEKNSAEALEVLKGNVEAPKGMLKNAIFVAMQNKSLGDVNLARKLASIESTRLGQEISILTEIDPNSPVKIMRDVVKVREDAFRKRFGGKTVRQATERVVSDIKAKIKRPDKYDWNSFLKTIEC